MAHTGLGPEMSKSTHAVKPLIMWAYLMSTRSSQPHRRLRPVVTPTSPPLVWSSSPVSWARGKRNECVYVCVTDKSHSCPVLLSFSAAQVFPVDLQTTSCVRDVWCHRTSAEGRVVHKCADLSNWTFQTHFSCVHTFLVSAKYLNRLNYK